VISEKKTTVQDGYKLGLLHRGAIPFVAGSEYKIKECRRGLEGTQKSLVDIGNAIRKKDMPHSFRHCGGWEAGAWCGALPTSVAHSLGHNFVGALHALIGDDVPQSIVDKLRQNVNREIPSLLKLGEIARTELRESWEATGADLGGRSTVDQFIVGCLDLVDKTLIAASTVR
jgi:hypothetical protein